MNKSVVRIGRVALLAASGMLAAQAWGAGGNLRYTISVSKFENRSGWSGQWEIGDAFGGRDHTTVLHACRKVKELIESDHEIQEDYRNLNRTLSV